MATLLLSFRVVVLINPGQAAKVKVKASYLKLLFFVLMEERVVLSYGK